MKISTILGGQPVTITYNSVARPDGYHDYTVTHQQTGASFAFGGGASDEPDGLRSYGWADASDAELGMKPTLEDYAEATGRELDTEEDRDEALASWQSCQESLANFQRLGMDPVNGECANTFTVIS